jgi:hypothetical protein
MYPPPPPPPPTTKYSTVADAVVRTNVPELVNVWIL